MFEGNGSELRWLFSVIRRWWWLIAGLTVLVVGAAYVITLYTPPVYESTATLMINSSESSTAGQLNDLMAGSRLALTYSQMLDDRPVLEAVIEELDLEQSPSDLAKQITAQSVRDTQLIQLTVTDSDPEQAARIANALAEAFSRRVAELSASRYGDTLSYAKKRIDDLLTRQKAAQSQLDSLRSQKITKEVSLSNQQTSLANLQADYSSFLNTYQDLQLEVAAITGQVYIVEPVQLQKSPLVAASKATAVVSIGQVQSIGGGSLANDRLALTYGNLLIKPSLLQGVVDELGLLETTSQLAKKISVEVVPGTQLIRFSVEDKDEIKAQLIAQSLVTAFVTLIKTLLTEPYSDKLEIMQNQLENLEESIDLTQTEIGRLTSETAQLAASLDYLESDLTMLRSDYQAAQENYVKIQETTAESSDAVFITELAQAAGRPRQNRILYIVIGGFFGMATGLGLAIFLGYIDGKIQTDQDIRTILNLPILGEIGQLSRKENELVMGYAPDSSLGEDFRMLGHMIHMSSESEPAKILLVTSPVPAEGKSFVVSNVAVSLSKMGLRIVVVDADLRFPRQHKIFGLAQAEGLSETLSSGNFNGSAQAKNIGIAKFLPGEGVQANSTRQTSSPHLAKLLKVLKEGVVGDVSPDSTPSGLQKVLGFPQKWGSSGKCQNESDSAAVKEICALKVITSGEPPSNPAELLISSYLVELLQMLRDEADIVLIDCPPILTTADTLLLASRVDGVLMVLRAGFSDNRAAQNAVKALRQVKANLVGVVLNHVKNDRHHYYRYYRRVQGKNNAR